MARIRYLFQGLNFFSDFYSTKNQSISQFTINFVPNGQTLHFFVYPQQNTTEYKTLQIFGVLSNIFFLQIQGQTSDHYTFEPLTTSSIPTITASGTGPNFAYHGPTHRGGGSLHLAGVDTPTCICNTGIKGSINGVPFSKNCAPEPTGK